MKRTEKVIKGDILEILVLRVDTRQFRIFEGKKFVGY